ncbi:PspA-associated protein PspAA [Tessaracoccus sp.]
MIIRIIGLGQWSMEPDELLAMNGIDEAVEKAVADGDQEALRVALVRLVAAVQERGTAVPDDVIVESDLVLPDADATVDEVKGLLDSTQEFYGLLPDTLEDENTPT